MWVCIVYTIYVYFKQLLVMFTPASEISCCFMLLASEKEHSYIKVDNH
jgi:hypothetical protein